MHQRALERPFPFAYTPLGSKAQAEVKKVSLYINFRKRPEENQIALRFDESCVNISYVNWYLYET